MGARSGSATDAPRVGVIVAFDQDVVRWRERHARGETLDVTPYGYDRAEPHVRLAWGRSHTESTRMRRIRVALAGRLGFDLVHVWRNRRLIREADVIWTHTEREHLAVAALQVFVPRRRRVPVIAQSVWLWDAWSQWGPLRRRCVASLLRTHAIEVTHSRINRDISRAAVPGRRVELLPFGSAALPTAVQTAPPGAAPLVLAVGNDIDRDWALLAEAARILPDARFRVASSSRRARETAWPSNVEVSPAGSRAALAELYAAASVIAVPLRENRHASGLTVCIEALGAARPLVVTAAGGIEDYVRGNARTVTVGDRDELVGALRSALAGEVSANRDAVAERGLTQRDYVNRYLQVTAWALGRQDWDAVVSAFAPVSAPTSFG